MDISIDESGSFTLSAKDAESWCVVAAYMSPETEKRKYTKLLDQLKRKQGKSKLEELKLHEISEENYFWFLENLGRLKGILLAVATDSHFNSKDFVAKHQFHQAEAVGRNIDKMKYEGGRKGTILLKSQLETLPHQLYVQLTCQIQLMLSVINRGICYFVQRSPNSLNSFRWRVDQKEPSKKTDFEDAFEKFSPVLLQTFSIDDPSPALDWCDYRPMKEFMLDKGELPGYLLTEFPELKGEQGLNIQKIIRGDIEFVDSKSRINVQVIDLLASGLRRVLKSGFTNNERAAHLLGKVMVQEEHNKPPLKLASFRAEEDERLSDSSSKAVKIMIKSCRRMIKRANNSSKKDALTRASS